MKKNQVTIYDTTLRDGTQREGISLSLADKLRITRLLDEMGVSYIEGGWPGSNPKDAAYFDAVQELELKHSKIAAFGSTCRKGSNPADDENTHLHAPDPARGYMTKQKIRQVFVLEEARNPICLPCRHFMPIKRYPTCVRRLNGQRVLRDQRAAWQETSKVYGSHMHRCEAQLFYDDRARVVVCKAEDECASFGSKVMFPV